AQRVTSKLADVCRQFLNWPLEAEALVRAAPDADEHLVLCCRPLHDKTQIAAGPHWQIVSDFLTRAKTSAAVEPDELSGQEASAMDQKKWAQRLTRSGADAAQPVAAA